MIDFENMDIGRLMLHYWQASEVMRRLIEMEILRRFELFERATDTILGEHESMSRENMDLRDGIPGTCLCLICETLRAALAAYRGEGKP